MKRLAPALLLLLVLADAAWACPGCKEGVTVGGNQSAGIGTGFSLSVLALLAAVGGVGFVLVRAVLKAVRRSEAAWAAEGSQASPAS
ncbi:MAG TPA: hypothetical protein VIM58_12605 [Candidatus Methylacidiphilales bacterium]